MKKIDRQIKFHNDSMQKLSRKHSVKFCDFLRSHTGNMFITGGDKNRRRQALLRQIELYRQTSNNSVVIFSNDAVIKQQLISAAQAGFLGQLFVVDKEYCSYDFFYGMPLNIVSDYFSKAALLRGYRDTSKLLTYADAFLDILAGRADVSLGTIREMLFEDDDVIIGMASSQDECNVIRASLEGGANLRDLVRVSSRAFAPLTAASCASKFNILSEIENDCVILIDVPTENHELFAAYFAMELKAVMNKPFYLIFDDEIMINNADMFEIVKMLKQRPGDVILSFDNIMSVQPINEDILDNFSRRLMFLNGNMPAVDLQHVLSRFGQFTQMQAMENRNAPPAYTFTLMRGKGENSVQFIRDRVMLQELYGMEAVLAGGSSAEITAVKQLII